MAIDLQNPQNIETGWRGPTQFQAPSGIGEILKNRLAQQEFQQKQIADAIKQYQSQREGQMYGQAARDAGLLPGVGDISGMTATQISDLAQRIGENTPDTDVDNELKARAAYFNAKASEPYAPQRQGVPRVWRQLPNGEWAMFPASEAYKIDQRAQDKEDYGRLSAAESQLAAKTTAIEKKYGIDSDGNLIRPSPQDQAEYNRLSGQAAMVKKNRENFEKYHRMVAPLPDSGSDGEDDGDTTPPAQPQSTPAMPPGVTYVPGPSGPQGGASPPPQAQASPSPAMTPRTGAPPPADSAAGHTATYGTPAPGGNAQTGDLVPGQSKRYVANKWWTWDGNQWQPD